MLFFMATDAKAAITDLLITALKATAPDAAGATITLERPKQAQHGDFSCNVAMQLAKALRAKPRDIAQQLLANLPASPLVDKAEIAGAGFINVFLNRGHKQSVVNQILTSGARYGTSAAAERKKIQVEFVSANPTGPLHVGHGRGAAYGACVANVLAAAGHEVSREFYINDAGRQMDILAVSVWLRYLEARGVAVAFPADGYRGDYVRDIARALDTQHGAQLQRERKARGHEGAGPRKVGDVGARDLGRHLQLRGDELHRLGLVVADPASGSEPPPQEADELRAFLLRPAAVDGEEDREGGGGEQHERQCGPGGCHLEKRRVSELRLLHQKRTLAEVIERECRQNEHEPSSADRSGTEVAHVGIQSLAAGHGEENAAEDDEGRVAARGQKVPSMPGIERGEDFRPAQEL